MLYHQLDDPSISDLTAGFRVEWGLLYHHFRLITCAHLLDSCAPFQDGRDPRGILHMIVSDELAADPV